MSTSLRDYMFHALSGYADFLGIDGSLDEWFDSVVEDIYFELDIESQDEAENTRELYAVAKYKVFQKLLVDLSSNYSYSADGESFNRNQMFDNVQKLCNQYYTDAFQFLNSGYVETVNF